MHLRRHISLALLLCSLSPVLAQEAEEFLLQASQLLERQQLMEAAALLEKGLQRHPQNAELLLQAGGLLIHLGQSERGEALLAEALRLQPNDPRILNRQGEAKLRQGKLTEAAERFRRALWQESKDARAHYQLGFTLFLRGDDEEALKHVRQAIEVNPLNPRYRRFHSLLLSIDGQLDASYQELRTARGLDPSNPAILDQLSQSSRRRGQLGQALEYAEMAWEIDPQNPLYARHIADINRRIGDTDDARRFEAEAEELEAAFQSHSSALTAQKEGRMADAIQELEETLQRSPNFQIALFHLAQLYSRSDQKKKAMATYQRLLALDPSNEAAREEGAWLYATEGALDKAIAMLAESRSASLNQQLLAGYQAMQEEEWANAVQILSEALSNNPLTPGLLELLAVSLRELGEPEQALAYFTKAGNLTTPSRVQSDIQQIHLEEALRFQDQENWSQAISIYDRLLGMAPGNTTYLLNRAYCRQLAGKLADAVKDYRAALRSDPQDWAQLNLASCLYRLQRYKEAAPAWEAVIRSAPSADSYYRLGLSYSHLERHPEAEAAFSKALEMGPRTPALLYNLGLARLKTLQVEDAWKLIREAARKGYPPASQLVAKARRRP